MSDQATPSQVVDALQSLVKEKADIGKQWALSVKLKSEDPSRKWKNVTINIENKGLKFKVNFIKYEQDED